MENKTILGLLVGTAAVFSYVVCTLSHRIDQKVSLGHLEEDNRANGTAKGIESEIFKEYASKKIDALRNGLDEHSNEILDYAL